MDAADSPDTPESPMTFPIPPKKGRSPGILKRVQKVIVFECQIWCIPTHVGIFLFSPTLYELHRKDRRELRAFWLCLRCALCVLSGEKRKTEGEAV